MWTLAAGLMLGACGTDGGELTSPTDDNGSTTGTGNSTTFTVSSPSCSEDAKLTNAYTVASAMAKNTVDHEVTSDYSIDGVTATTIALNGTTATVTGSGATVSGSTVTIGSAGTYRLSGTMTDGQVFVSTADTGLVRLVLDGASISRSTDAPLYVSKAKRAAIVLVSGTTNVLQDGTSYPTGAEQNAPLYSKVNLSIGGEGTLNVTGKIAHGIHSKDGLVIRSGRITVTAADDGIRGKDYLVVRGGTIGVTAGSDALKSNEDGDAALGYVLIAGGTFTLAAGNDAVQAETDLLMTGGTITAVTRGGSSTVIPDTLSAKGLKAGVMFVADGGTATLNTADDGLHSNANLVVNGGTFTISTGDDGVHADSAVTINGGSIDVTKSYEGIEAGKADMTFNGGRVRVVASDDGINLSGDGDGARGTGNYTIRINGGRITSLSGGDGIDSNSAIAMTGGCLLVAGPPSGPNPAIDYDRTFVMTGGFLVGTGTTSMAQAPGTASTQPSIQFTFGTARAAGGIMHIQTSAGAAVFDLAPVKGYQSLVVSSPLLTVGGSYKLYAGGTESGTATDGLYTSGQYTLGTLVQTFTLSAITNRITVP
ncbi:MAG TPA: carbohydrate-binding domain-containing protein [Gemmatimonas sp.]|uniref:carbohydrate-binding domain-containing protein n=1 Tax=Gemmatimonas sp. TaxID=1962908 RepID=UPI002ED794C1